jgi:hypothetical protein
MPLPTVDQILAAISWRQLGLPHEPAALRRLRRLVHPDVSPHPAANTAFAKLTELFEGGEFALRVATARRETPGQLRWTLGPDFEDLAHQADRAHADLEWCALPRFFTRLVHQAGPAQRIVAYGTGKEFDAAPPPQADNPQFPWTDWEEDNSGWWFLEDFGQIDTETSVWVAKRLAAAISQAASTGWVHTDLNPATIVINPAEHGLRLDGWWLGERLGNRLTIRPTAPTLPRYLGGSPVDPLLSVSQAAACLRDGGAKGRLQELFAASALRPQSPEQFAEAVTTEARSVMGPDRWHPLAPPGTPSL